MRPSRLLVLLLVCLAAAGCVRRGPKYYAPAPAQPMYAQPIPMAQPVYAPPRVYTPQAPTDMPPAPPQPAPAYGAPAAAMSSPVPASPQPVPASPPPVITGSTAAYGPTVAPMAPQ